jgi:hypothetical protein
MSWLFSLGLNVTSFWEPWFFKDALYGNRLGGYYSKLEGIHFATVHGAGHEVPAFKPEAAQTLFQMFLKLTNTGPGKGRAYEPDDGSYDCTSSSDNDDDDGDETTAEGLVWAVAFICLFSGFFLAFGVLGLHSMYNSTTSSHDSQGVKQGPSASSTSLKQYRVARDIELPEKNSAASSSASSSSDKYDVDDDDDEFEDVPIQAPTSNMSSSWQQSTESPLHGGLPGIQRHTAEL